MLAKCLPLFCLLYLRQNLGLNFRVVNGCSTTISPRYHYPTQSGGFTLGPQTYTNLTIVNTRENLTIWAIPGASRQCPVRPQGELVSNFSAIYVDSNASYYASLAGRSLDVDICPATRSTNGTCSCASTCTCVNTQNAPACPSTCDFGHQCGPSVVDFVVTFCPQENLTSVTSTTAIVGTDSPPNTPATSRPIGQLPPKSATVNYPSSSTATTVNPDYATERPCACSMDKLWLDIVIALDTSTTMGSNGLENVANLLIKLFTNVNVGQGLRHQTRIGIVSYASKDQVVANWSTYESFEQFKDGLNSVRLRKDDPVVGLLEAFKAIERVIHGRKLEAFSDINGTGHTNRRIVCILVASAYEQGQEVPMPLVEQIRADGQRVFTIAVLPKGADLADAHRIGSMASEGMNFTIDRDANHVPDTIVERMRRSLCEANCFCLSEWLQLGDSFRNPRKRFGECL